jgi:NifU-like protein involved in Fe-S cluster formation
MYSKTVMDHFKNPRNVGTLENADGVGEIGNPLCGDMMTVYRRYQVSDIRMRRRHSCLQYANRDGKGKKCRGRQKNNK